jgi:GcrA cell cycle regulator
MSDTPEKFWTDARVTELTCHVKAGLTGSQIGARMGVTRSKIIGKTHRLGLHLGDARGALRRPRYNPVLLDNGTRRTIAEMHAAGASTRVIAATVGVPQSTLAKYLRDHGLETAKDRRPTRSGYLMDKASAVAVSAMARPHGFDALNIQRVKSRRDASPGIEATDCPDVLPRPAKAVRVLDLNDTTCRWPYGDVGTPEFTFCGRKPEKGKPYCPAHLALAWEPVERRRATRAKREAAE